MSLETTLDRFEQRSLSRSTQASGREAEEQALRALRAAGLVPVTRNFRCRTGEIDLVMKEGATLVFVEVRFRRSALFGGPAESINAAKQRRILSAARYYLQCHPEAGKHPCRFDVVAICPQADPPLDWIRDAFRAD